MRVQSAISRRPLRMDITPLIDMVFNLVIFFLVASHFSSSETQAPVELPKATTSKEDSEDPRRLIVTITADEKLHIGEQVLELPELTDLVKTEFERQGPEFSVQVRSDRRVPYRVVEPLLLACARIGITKFGFKTDSQ